MKNHDLDRDDTVQLCLDFPEPGTSRTSHVDELMDTNATSDLLGHQSSRPAGTGKAIEQWNRLREHRLSSRPDSNHNDRGHGLPFPYTGQAGGLEMRSVLSDLGVGELLQPGDFPPRLLPYALDNGAFRAYTRQIPWDASAFERMLTSAGEHSVTPDFIVAPDIVAGGLESLTRSIEWFERCASVGPVYLAVQDGMSVTRVLQVLDNHPFAGIFVGGSKPWKVATGKFWVELAHKRDIPCHVARAGTTNAVSWARSIGADSLDSSLPLWSRPNLARFVRGFLQEILPLAEPVQQPW